MQDKKRIYLILIFIMAVMVVVEILFAHPHFDMIWNKTPGADIIIGFVGAWFLILISKKLITFLFQRKEDYYDDGGDENA